MQPLDHDFVLKQPWWLVGDPPWLKEPGYKNLTMVMKSPISWDIARIFFNGYFGEIMKYLQLYQTYIILFIFFNQPRYVLMAQMTPIVTKPHAVWGSSSPGSAMDSPWASRTPRIGAKLGRLLGVFLILWIFMAIFFVVFWNLWIL